MQKNMTDKINRLPLKGGKMKKSLVPYRYIYIIKHFTTNFNKQTVKNIYCLKKSFVQYAQKVERQ